MQKTAKIQAERFLIDSTSVLLLLKFCVFCSKFSSSQLYFTKLEMPLAILFCTQLSLSFFFFLLKDTIDLKKTKTKTATTALLFFLVINGIHSYFKQFYKMKTKCKAKITYCSHTWRYLLLTLVLMFFQKFVFIWTDINMDGGGDGLDL